MLVKEVANTNTAENLSLTVGLCFYQDLPGLLRLYESLRQIPFITTIYAIDGRFHVPDFGNVDDPELTDLPQEVKELPKLKYLPKPNVMEVEKRQEYLNQCYKDKPDFLIILDTDETLIVDLPALTNHLLDIKQPWVNNRMYIYHNVYDVSFIDDTQGGIRNTKNRMLFRPSQMEYHNGMALRNKQYPIWHCDPIGNMSPHPDGPIKGLTIVHDKSIRDKEYEEKNEEFHEKQSGRKRVRVSLS